MKQREWDVWFEWCMLNPGPPRRQLEGVVVWRDGLKVRVEGARVDSAAPAPAPDDGAYYGARQGGLAHGRGVLFRGDGVGDAFILKKNREALQGRAKQAKGAQSAKMMYSHKYTLARRAGPSLRRAWRPSTASGTSVAPRSTSPTPPAPRG